MPPGAHRVRAAVPSHQKLLPDLTQAHGLGFLWLESAADSGVFQFLFVSECQRRAELSVSSMERELYFVDQLIVCGKIWSVNDGFL